MPDQQVSQATVADRAGVVRTFVAAFATDPALRFFFPDDASYPELAAQFAGYVFDKRVGRGGAFVINGGSAVSLWEPPGVSGATDGGGDSHAVPTLNLPDDASNRLAAYDEAVHELLPSAPHWYLGVLATHPSYAGRGWGLSVMRAGLTQAARDELPAFLETTNPANVAWYARAGWEVSGTARVGDLEVSVLRHPGRELRSVPTGR